MSTEIEALQAQVKQLQDDMQHLKWYLGLPQDVPLKNEMRPSLRCGGVTLVNDAGEAVGSWQPGTPESGPDFWMAASEPGEVLLKLGVDKATGGYVTVCGMDGIARAQMYVKEDRGEVVVYTTGGQPRAGMKAFPTGGSVAVLDESLKPRGILMTGEHGGDLLMFDKQDQRAASRRGTRAASSPRIARTARRARSSPPKKPAEWS